MGKDLRLEEKDNDKDLYFEDKNFVNWSSRILEDKDFPGEQQHWTVYCKYY